MTAERTARRFFWTWLLASAGVSILGVVTHAVLGNAPSPVIASVLAVVIVMIQLAATYGVHVLVQAHIIGATYRWALSIAITLALGAFVLNFVALQDLVITWAGIAPVIAWIVPLIIDLGMTGSTIALLALTNTQRATQLHHDSQAAVRVEVHSTVHTETHTSGQPAGQIIPARTISEPPTQHNSHLAIAERLVAQGIVRIAPERVAQVLEAHAAGAAPSAIQRNLKVGYSTVRRVIDHQADRPSTETA